MKNKLIILTLAILLLIGIPIVSADNNTFTAGDIINVWTYCMELNNSKCDYHSTSCEITAFYPNTSWLTQQSLMQGNASGFYNYSFGVLGVNGTYSALVYCNNTEEGAINFEFIVGEDEDLYDETFWLFVFLLLVPMIMCILGYIAKDKYFNIIAGMVLCCACFYFRDVGFLGLSDTFITQAAITVIAGVGLYLIVKNGYDLIMEGNL